MDENDYNAVEDLVELADSDAVTVASIQNGSSGGGVNCSTKEYAK